MHSLLLLLIATALAGAANADFAASVGSGPTTFVVTQGTSSQADGFLRFLKESDLNERCPTCHVRAVVRDASTTASMAVAALGVEVFECADVSVECFKRAFLPAAAGQDVDVFAITFAMSESAELTQATAIADAALTANVHKVVVSSGDKIEDPEWRALGIKNRVEQVFRSRNLNGAYIHTSFFFENMVQKQAHKRVQAFVDSADSHSTAAVAFSLPLWADEAIPMLASADVGRVAAALLLSPKNAAFFGTGEEGAVIPLAGDIVSPGEFVNEYATVTGIPTKYVTVKPDWLLSHTPAGHSREMAELVALMYRWYERGHPGHERNIDYVRREFPMIQSLRQWMESTGVKLVQKAVE